MTHGYSDVLRDCVSLYHTSFRLIYREVRECIKKHSSSSCLCVQALTFSPEQHHDLIFMREFYIPFFLYYNYTHAYPV